MSTGDAFDAITGSMPEPQPHAIAAEAGKSAETAPGGPRLKKDGTPQAKRGPKPKSSVGSGASSLSPTLSPAYQTGVRMGETLLLVSAMWGGQDFVPIEDQDNDAGKVARANNMSERKSFTDAWGKYAEARGMTELPPSFGLVVAHAAFFGPRFAKPKVRSRLAPLFDAAKVRLYALYLKMRGREQPKMPDEE